MLVVRNILGHARTAREAIHIINTGKVKVDGVIRRDHRFPVGLMDVLQIEGTTDAFRVLPKHNIGLALTPINQKEVSFKLCKIVGKMSLTGGRTQLNFHDGRNMIIQTRDPRQKTGEEYTVGGTIQLGLPGQKIIGQVPFQNGAIGLVIDGRNQGLVGRIESITPGTHAREKSVRIETSSGSFETPAAYVIPVGTNNPLIVVENK